MIGSFTALIDREGREGKALHASWDADRFNRLIQGPGVRLRDALAGSGQTDDALSAYAMMLREALGSGYLGSTDPEPGHWPNFLSFALLDLVPKTLADEPESERVASLADLWNIGEGLLSAPPWVDRYVLACSSRLRRVGDLKSFVADALGPALAPAEPAMWSGPFSVSTIDARTAIDGFLPGELYLATPRIVCVQDRRDPSHYLGLLLGQGGETRWLGPTPALNVYIESGAIPVTGLIGTKVRVGDHKVDLPLLGEPHRMAVARAGFVVVSVVDSQRLWIVETP